MMPSKFQEIISNPKNPLQEAINKSNTSKITKKEKEKANCLRLGGRWDEANGVCIFPENQTGPNTKKESVETPDGRTFLGLNKTDKAAVEQGFNPQQSQGKVLPNQVVPLGTTAQLQQQQQAREQAVLGSGVLSQTSPEFEQLDIQQAGPIDQTTPIIGPSAAAVSAALQKDVEFRESKSKLNDKIYKNGLDASEKFGVFVEAIPIVGKFAANYANGLNTPTGNIRDIRSSITDLREAAEFQATSAKEGRVDPQKALQTIIEMQERVEEMESRLKYLIQFSTVLRTSSDEVDKMEVEIFRTKQKLFQAGQIAAAGAIKEPDETDVYLALEDLKKRGSNK